MKTLRTHPGTVDRYEAFAVSRRSVKRIGQGERTGTSHSARGWSLAALHRLGRLASRPAPERLMICNRQAAVRHTSADNKFSDLRLRGSRIFFESLDIAGSMRL